MKLNLLIVEDSISYATELEQLAAKIGFNVIGNVDNSAEALDTIFSKAPDIILMDINIKGMLSGIDIANKINHLNIPVLYITSFNDDLTYQKASESNLVGYIVKPVDKLTLATSLKLLIKTNILGKNNSAPTLFKKEEENYIFFLKNNIYQKVNVSLISYVKSDDNYCQFVLKDSSSYHIRIKMTEVESLLTGRQFIRCHRQYIVNQKEIRSMNSEMNTLDVGIDHIPFSRSKKQSIMSIGIFLK